MVSLHGEQTQRPRVLFAAGPANLAEHSVPAAHAFFRGRPAVNEHDRGAAQLHAALLK